MLSGGRYIVNRFYNQVINGGVEGDRTGVSDMIREMFLYYYGEHRTVVSLNRLQAQCLLLVMPNPTFTF